jgi:rhodanese-related sulfurtransferase
MHQNAVGGRDSRRAVVWSGGGANAPECADSAVPRLFGRCRDYAHKVTISAVTVRTALLGALLALALVVTSCASTSEADGKVRVVGAREAVTLIESGDYVMLDLRNPAAFEAGRVAGARSMPFGDDGSDLARELETLDPEDQYLLYSRDPAVADQAADLMVALGFTHVVDAGSFGLLALAGAPLE